MTDINGLELSARRAEYLKFIYTCGDVVRTSDLSDHFEVAPSTITKTLEEMAAMGYLLHERYRGVRLTPEGAAYARFLLRRHRILSLMLSRCGLSAEEACQEAEGFEGYVSKLVVDRMCASLGHPVMSVCGRIEHDACCCPQIDG